MKKCPFCAEEIQDAAKVCKHCGRELNAEQPAISTETKSRWMWTLFGIAAVVIVLAAIGSRNSSDSEAVSRPSAAQICTQFVTDRLRSPASAKFQSIYEADVSGPMHGEYTVTSHVDSQNGFGALLRMNYICTVESPIGGKQWRLVDLKIDGK